MLRNLLIWGSWKHLRKWCEHHRFDFSWQILFYILRKTFFFFLMFIAFSSFFFLSNIQKQIFSVWHSMANYWFGCILWHISFVDWYFRMWLTCMKRRARSNQKLQDLTEWRRVIDNNYQWMLKKRMSEYINIVCWKKKQNIMFNTFLSLNIDAPLCITHTLLVFCY